MFFGSRFLFAGLMALPGLAWAGEADIVDVEVVQASSGKYDFHVTVRHEDDGWDHYANVWQVIGPDGAMLGERKLLHPHDNEQPFTRSLMGVAIPDGVETVTLRAGDTVHEFGGKEMPVRLPGR